MTQEVKLMVGIPGSGKSTWIQQLVKSIEADGRTTCVISRDYVRQSMLKPNEAYFARETEVFKEFVRQINEAMEIGFDVVFIDATHISAASRRKVLSKLLPDPRTNLTIEIIDAPVEVAIERNALREGFDRVPDSAIQRMGKQLTIPTSDEFPLNLYGFRTITIKIHKRG